MWLPTRNMHSMDLVILSCCVLLSKLPFCATRLDDIDPSKFGWVDDGKL
jgi:hypothetical protein